MRNTVLTILHEDDAIVVLDKPSGLPCIPERHGEATTVLHALKAMIEQPAGQLLRVVHRLDRDTSGVMLVARTAEAQRGLTAQFMARTIVKTYLAIVRGRPTEPAGRVDAPIGQKRGSLVSVCINPKRSRPAVTDWEVVEAFIGYTLVRCRPLTGRQHQIRVHMQVAGLPLAVDELYGGGSGILLSSFKPGYQPSRRHEERPLIDRLTLHAESIEFDHPKTGSRMRFESPLPKDFRATLNQLRRHASLSDEASGT